MSDRWLDKDFNVTGNLTSAAARAKNGSANNGSETQMQPQTQKTKI